MLSVEQVVNNKLPAKNALARKASNLVVTPPIT